jgi:signal transduction histidine kinase
MLVTFVALSLRYLQRPGASGLLAVGLIWLVALIVVNLSQGTTNTLGTAGWLGQAVTSQPHPAEFITLAGWIVLAVIVLLASFYSFYRAHLPEIANRALFWVIVVPLLWMATILGVSGNDILKELGWLTQFVALLGVLYGTSTHRVFDIRRVLRLAIASTLVTGVTAGVVLVTLLAARPVDPGTSNGVLILVGLAILAAIIYAPIRTFMTSLVNRFFGSFSDDTAGVLRRYSQDVSGVVELDQLVDVAMNTLRDTMRVRRGGLILATRDDNETIRVEPMSKGLGEMPDVRGWIPKDNPIYHTLFDQLGTLLQFDLEYAREYADVAPELKSFFKQLRMSAYAPIVVQGQLLGVLAAGAKNNDNPFYPQDLELLATIANQTGVALRNARLVNDLRKASDEMQTLNKDLVHTKERIEQLDSVKTDFITIASHELRTPLAQIRGYTDIMDALNEQGMLDPDQMTGMTTNLRKATDRLERLIGDMLDVSQLGLDAMDLRFAQTTTESVLRLAIEPLTESVKQRKLTLVARGLRGLPPIEADMQRLVQAFRNVVTNAIKYTPDGGRIDISAQLQQNADTKQDEIMVSIQDTGIGIDPRNNELIFEKFFRVSDPGLHSTGATKFMGAGPGLGLTIARGVIEGHGGRIWVESNGYDLEKLPGSTFYIVLPIHPPESAKRVVAFEGTQPNPAGTTSPQHVSA